MAIFVKAEKKEETENAVIYSYGENPNNLEGIIEFDTTNLSWRVVKLSSIRGGKFSAVSIIPRILKYYQENGSFPDVIYKES
ncbi:MAG: hypothetical protein MR434_07715 [Ruminococcus sp.]|nr:hypothetical protein [Ruminococcus sp.]